MKIAVSLALAFASAAVASASTMTTNMNENSNLRGSSPLLVSDGSFRDYVDEATSKEGANNAFVAVAQDEDADISNEELADVAVPEEEEFIYSEAGWQPKGDREPCEYNSECYSYCCINDMCLEYQLCMGI